MSLRLVGPFFLCVMILGCAGSKVAPVQEVNDQTVEIPKEVQAKFEVKAAEFSTDELKAQLKIPETLKSKKAKAKAKKAAATKSFTYPNRRPVKDPIWVDEKLVYEITYFGMSAGDFTLEVLPYKKVADRKVYYIKGVAKTSNVFSLFYKVDDSLETFIDYEGFFSHRFQVKLDETKQARSSLELYDSEKKQTYFWDRWNRKDQGYQETQKTSEMPIFPQDSLSSLYYLRVIPLVEGKEVTFPVVSEGKFFNLHVNVVKRENLETPLGNVKTIVVKPQTQSPGEERKGESLLWLTDDDRRIAVKLEAKVKVGTIAAWLKKAELGTPPAL
jgi:hypothetical protein